MPENTLVTFHEWLANVFTWRVNALVHNNPVALERFHEKIWRWYLGVKIWNSQNKVLERRRDEHIDTILATPQLRDKSAGPPQPEWEWWQTVRSILANDDAGWPHQIVYVKGWAPPELIHDELEQYWPLPLSKRPLRIEEKYTLLAAVHDHFCEGVEKIRPWPDQVQDDSVKAYVESTLYRQIVSDVTGLTVRDQPAIKTFLADVEDDLAKPSAGAVRRFWHILRTCALPWRRARYPIEAELLRSPTPSETPPSEALPQPQQSQTSDGNRVGLSGSVSTGKPGEQQQEPVAAGDSEEGAGVDASQTELQLPIRHPLTSPPKEALARRSPTGGMPWEKAKKKAEEYVRRNGYPGFKSLVRVVGCGVGTMNKAINNSTYLKARKVEYEAKQKGKPYETPLTDVVRDNTVQSTEVDPSESLRLKELIDEQEADKRRDARRPRPRASK